MEFPYSSDAGVGSQDTRVGAEELSQKETWRPDKVDPYI